MHSLNWTIALPNNTITKTKANNIFTEALGSIVGSVSALGHCISTVFGDDSEVLVPSMHSKTFPDQIVQNWDDDWFSKALIPAHTLPNLFSWGITITSGID